MYTNNFYNPYLGYNYINGMGKASLFKGLFKNFSLNKFLTGTGKTLNVINQAIPIYYQVKPMINNAKTMFKVMGAIKNDNTNTIKTSNISINKNTNNYKKDGSPTFFI